MHKIKLNKLFTIIYFVFSLLLLLSIIMILYTLIYLPLPERFFLNELDKFAIAAGQGKSLIFIYLFSSLGIVSLILSIFFGCYLFYLNTYLDSWFYKNINNKYLLHFAMFVVLVCSIILPSIMCFFYIRNIFYLKNKRINFYKNRIYKLNYKNNILLATTIISPIAILTIPASLVLSHKRIEYVNQGSVNNFLKLSNTNENTLMLYFDRATGFLWNSLLLWDYDINKENSFIKLFPEFTSFVKSFSYGRQTNTSNPSIVSGPFFSSIFDGYDLKPSYDKNDNFKNLTINQFWSNAFYNQFKMLESKNVENINISSTPYYSYNGNRYGEPTLFEDSINKVNNDKLRFSLTTNEAIAKIKNNYEGFDRLSNAYALKNAKNLITFENQGSTYIGWYFNHTHEDYCYYDYDKQEYVNTHSNEYIDFIKSQWFSIIELKDFLLKLKTTKHLRGGSIYDNIQISIISDHGYSITKNELAVNALLEKIQSNFNLPKLDYVNNPNFAWNNMFMFKPFKKVKNVNNTKLSNFFDSEHFVLSSDLPFFFEEGLNKYKGINNYYFVPDLSNYSSDLKKYFEQLIVKDPFTNLDKLNNRYVFIEFSDWRFSKRKKYLTYEKFVLQDSDKNNFYDLFLNGSQKI